MAMRMNMRMNLILAALMGIGGAGALAQAPGAERAVVGATVEEAKADLKGQLARAIAEFRVKAEEGSAIEAIARTDKTSWRVKSEVLEKLAERLNAQSKGAPSAGMKAYSKAAEGFLADPDPEVRGMACVFLGLLKTHGIETGAIVELAKWADDERVAFKGIRYPRKEVPQQGPGRTVWVNLDLRVRDLAIPALYSATSIWFESHLDFDRFWQLNSDYEKHFWYWAQRWASGDGEMAKDFPGVFDGDLKLGLNVVILGGAPGLVRQDAKRKTDCTVVQEPSAEVVADWVKKQQLKGMLLDLAAGRIREDLKLDDYGDCTAFYRRLLPVLEVALNPEDTGKLVQTLKESAGVVGKYGWVQVQLTQLAEKLEPKNAASVVREQLKRNPTLPTLATDLVKLEGVAEGDWDLIRNSYMNPDFGDEDSRVALISAVASCKGGAARLAELVEADDLRIVLSPNGLPDEDWKKGYDKEMRLREFVKVSGAMNGGKLILDEEAVKKASLEPGMKAGKSIEEMAEHNRAAVGARKEAVGLLVKFFKGK